MSDGAIQRVLLVNPHWSSLRRQGQGQFRRAWPPLDLALAAQMLEDAGIEAVILDNNVEHRTPEDIGELATGFDLVFATSSPYDRWQCPALDITFVSDTIRDIPRDRLVIMGAHVSERVDVLLRSTLARAAIVHEPEQTILDVCRHGLRAGAPGLAMLEGDTVLHGPEPAPLDLEATPFPALRKLPLDRYYYELMGRDFAIMEASRGCPFRCTFCYLGMYGKRFRQKSVDRFLAEIRWTVCEAGVRNIYFMDLEFALNRRFVVELCNRILAGNLRFNWCCQTRVSDVDDELVALMKRAGCSLIHFGIESGSDRILQETAKRISVADAERAIAITNRHGVRSAVFMNIGFRGETAEDVQATRELAVRLAPSFASFHIVIPFPGTPLGRDVSLADLAPEQYPQSLAASEEEFARLKRELRRCYARFYLRPAQLRRMWREGNRSLVWQQVRTLADLAFT
jgi:MoaA/NifB/PqqE/SkfB family radical SAM enzyme